MNYLHRIWCWRSRFSSAGCDGSGIIVSVNEDSERLQLLCLFYHGMEKKHYWCKLLIKSFGKCTTDHISMVGPWLRFRGHLDNISNNTCWLCYQCNKSKQKSKQLTVNMTPFSAVARAKRRNSIYSCGRSQLWWRFFSWTCSYGTRFQ
jgi:aconitate hydratase